MDTEQLKLILELVSNTTGDAKQVAVAWLAIQALGPIVSVVGYSLLAWFGINCVASVRNVIRDLNMDSHSISELARIVSTDDEKQTARRHGVRQAIYNATIVERVREAFEGKNQ